MNGRANEYLREQDMNPRASYLRALLIVRGEHEAARKLIKGWLA